MFIVSEKKEIVLSSRESLQKLTDELAKEEGDTVRVRRLKRLCDDLHNKQCEKRKVEREYIAMRRKTDRHYGQRRREKTENVGSHE